MQDDGFEKRIRFGQLFAIYGGLLTEKQQNIMEQYFYDDLSLGEIAENTQTTKKIFFFTFSSKEIFALLILTRTEGSYPTSLYGLVHVSSNTVRVSGLRTVLRFFTTFMEVSLRGTM